MTVARVGVVALLGGIAGAALAHPLAPALLQLREVGPESYEVLWRTTAQRVQLRDVTPQLPPSCAPDSGLPAVETQGAAVALRWGVRCAGGIAGATLRFEGLERSQINVIVRIEPLAGAISEALLDAGRHEYTVPAAAAAPVARYFGLGVGHLLGGFDHLLFVAGLTLLVAGWRRLLFTVTAFTLGHSLTLALAALGYLRLDPAITELGIALSLLLLAGEAARPDPSSVFRRRPWAVAAAFGLLHGLGFAGALAQVGLPGEAIVPALFGFNLGIEAGQVGVIAVLLVVQRIVALAPRPARSAALASLPVYAVGTLAAYWCFERASVLWS